MDRESTLWRKEGNQTITSFNTEIHGVGCGLDRVWIGLDPGLDRPRPRIGPTFLCMLHLGCSVTRKRTTRWAGSKWTAWLLDSLAAWLSNTCSLAAWQLDCLAAQLYNKCSLTAWKLGSVALQQFVACLAGWITEDINSPIYSIIPKVWINSLGKVWIGGLDQRSGSFVGPGLDPDLTFWAAAKYTLDR